MIGRLIGRIVRVPAVRDAIITYAKRSPEFHIIGDDGTVYMYRFWLFNPIANQKRKYPFIPFSLRVHGIMRADQDRHPHDHPWPARTWIMDGWYFEARLAPSTLADPNWNQDRFILHRRIPGETAKLGVRQYHRIMSVSPGGAWTLFMFGRYREQWGFLVDGQKVGFRQYELRKKCEAAQHSDQMLCEKCGIGWDVNDPCRPDCKAEL
jgi:hypothetical protein